MINLTMAAVAARPHLGEDAPRGDGAGVLLVLLVIWFFFWRDE